MPHVRIHSEIKQHHREELGTGVGTGIDDRRNMNHIAEASSR